MAKGLKDWKSWMPTGKTFVKVGLTLVGWRLLTRYLVVPYQAKLPAVVRDNWPTPS